MQDEDCIFCKIAGGKIPSKKVHEDARHLAFLDINPKSKGHTLVIPKSHYATFLDIPESEAKELFDLAQKVAKKLKENLGAKFVFLVVMGIDVPHTHVHLIPAYEGDSEPFAVQLGPSKKMDLDVILKQIKGEA